MKIKKLIFTLILFFAVSFGVEAQCNFTIQMTDTFGDGWNGASISVTQGGTTIGTATISTGSTNTVTINGTSTGIVTFTWTDGNWDSECQFTISSNGAVIYTQNSAGSLSGTFFTYSCTPCQDFTFTVNGMAQNDDSFLDLCSTAELTAIGTYPNNGINYQQSDANVTWDWDISYQGTHYTNNGVGANVFTPTFTDGGGYIVNVTATDENGCTFTHTPISIRVALNLIWNGNAPDSVCPGETFTLDMGQFDTVNNTSYNDMSYNVIPWSYTEPEILFETHCFLDEIQDVPQSAEFTYTTFNPASTITSVDQIESIVIYMEHSYIGDLSMYITCPNGSQIDLITYGNQSCGSAYLGIPIDDYCGLCDSDCEIDPATGNPINGGTVRPYTWAPNGTTTLNDACDGYYSATVPNNTILIPENGFTPLIGCPLNGTWTISIVDYLGADDGYVNQFEIHFDPALTQACAQSTAWEINPTYNTPIWSGPGVTGGVSGTVQALCETPGITPYTFSITDDFGCVHDTTVNVVVRNLDDINCCIYPEASAGNDTTVCGNIFPFNPNVTTGTLFEWELISKPAGANDPNIMNANSANATVNIGTDYGTYSFLYTEINQVESCSNKDTIEVTFIEIPTSTFNSTQIMCFGDETTITYTGNMAGVATAGYNWNFGGGLSTNVGADGAGPYNVEWGDAGVHTVTLTVTNGICSSTQTNVNVLTPEQLELFLSITNVTCNGFNNGIATATVLGGTPEYDYSWASGTAIQQDLPPTTHDVTVTDANGCEQSQSFIITEPELLEITDTSYIHLQCFESNNGSISIEVDGGTIPLSYDWNDGFQGEPNRVGLAAGHYVITISDANGCSVTESFDIEQPDEFLAIINPSSVLCEGQEAIIQVQGIGGVPQYHYYWSISPTNPTFTEGPSTIIETPSVSTVYRCRLEDSHNCFSNEVITQVTISPDIIIDTVILHNNSCYQSCDGEVELEVIGGIPPLQYSWASPNSTLHNVCAGLYTLTINDAAGCYETTSFIIDEPTALSYTTSSQGTSCYGAEDGYAGITVSGGTPPYSYLWPDGQTTSSITTGAGVYEVTVTDFNNCRISSIINIESPTEMITLDMDDRTICLGSPTTLITESTGGTQYYDYHWSDNYGNEYFDNAWTVNPTENTTYTLTVTDANGCTNSPRPVTVSVYKPVVINSIYADTETICPGQDVNIRVDVSGGNGGPYLMSFSLNRNGTADTIVGSPFTINPLESAWYYVFVEDMCANGFAIDSIEILVNPNPNKGFTVDTLNGCGPLTVAFNDENIQEYDEYLWRFGDSTYSADRFVSHTYTKPGTYSVEFEIRDDLGCNYKYTAENLITVYPLPVSLFNMSSEIINPEQTLIEFENKSEDAIRYYWSFGDGDSSININPTHYFNINALEYSTCLVAENTYNCRDTSCRTISVDGLMTIYFPTSFSPNDDGKNDCFKPCGYGINPSGYSLKIFDRYGEVIFKTDTFIETNTNSDCSECSEGAWNGRKNNKGETLMVGSYIWQCVFKDKFDNQYTKEGSVTLIR